MASALEELRIGAQLTGGIYGALNSLRYILDRPVIKQGRVVAFFDHSPPPRRLRLLPDYKGERKRRDLFKDEAEKERAFSQIDQCWEMFQLLGVTCLRYREREADDGVAAAVRLFAEAGERPVVVSADRDLWQTVAMGARIWDLGSQELFTADQFVERALVAPEHYVLFRALVGDASDSIAGVPGCGPKRATELVAELSTEASPQEQLVELCRRIAARPRRQRRKFEMSVVTHRPYVSRVIKGIDLSQSFGPTTGLAEALQAPVKVERLEFLRFCKRLGFRSVLQGPDRYLKPFEKGVSNGRANEHQR